MEAVRKGLKTTALDPLSCTGSLISDLESMVLNYREDRIIISGVRKQFILMGFSFSGMAQTRTSDNHGKFIDAVTIWNFPGQNWQT
jgi:hypothetical protein